MKNIQEEQINVNNFYYLVTYQELKITVNGFILQLILFVSLYPFHNTSFLHHSFPPTHFV